MSDLLQTDFSWILVVSGEALERFGIAEVMILHHTFVKNCFEQLLHSEPARVQVDVLHETS